MHARHRTRKPHPLLGGHRMQHPSPRITITRSSAMPACALQSFSHDSTATSIVMTTGLWSETVTSWTLVYRLTLRRTPVPCVRVRSPASKRAGRARAPASAASRDLLVGDGQRGLVQDAVGPARHA